MGLPLWISDSHPSLALSQSKAQFFLARSCRIVFENFDVSMTYVP